MRILIAEDDFTSRTVLAGVLEKSGHEVVETVNGAAAWDALQQPDAPRLVILDWMMPEMDGLEVLRGMRGPVVETDEHPSTEACAKSLLQRF
jgi:CheY-like chemotaxis protein